MDPANTHLQMDLVHLRLSREAQVKIFHFLIGFGTPSTTSSQSYDLTAAAETAFILCELVTN